MAMADDDWRIRSFFDWFRMRVTNLERIAELGEAFAPEQHVLLATGIDSLANSWAKLYPELLSDRAHPERMGDFLEAHGGEFFARVSGPDLIRRAHAEKLPQDHLAKVRTLSRPLPADTLIRVWRDDPTLDEVVADAAAVGLDRHRDWFRESRIGEILYRKYRCNWVHELDGSRDLSTRQFSDRTDEPHYDNMLQRDGGVRNRLIFTAPFLIRTYSKVLHSFELKCLADQRVPEA